MMFHEWGRGPEAHGAVHRTIDFYCSCRFLGVSVPSLAQGFQSSAKLNLSSGACKRCPPLLSGDTANAADEDHRVVDKLVPGPKIKVVFSFFLVLNAETSRQRWTG